MFHTKLTLVALLTLGTVACTQDKPKSDTAREAKAPTATAVTAEAATQVATAPKAAGQAEDGYSCDKGEEEHVEAGGCNKWDEAASDVTKRTVPDDAVWVAFNVDGMTCGGCERRIQAEVGDLKGVVAVEASSELSRVRIAFESGTENEQGARARIASLGYKVR